MIRRQLQFLFVYIILISLVVVYREARNSCKQTALGTSVFSGVALYRTCHWECHLDTTAAEAILLANSKNTDEEKLTALGRRFFFRSLQHEKEVIRNYFAYT